MGGDHRCDNVSLKLFLRNIVTCLGQHTMDKHLTFFFFQDDPANFRAPPDGPDAAVHAGLPGVPARAARARGRVAHRAGHHQPGAARIRVHHALPRQDAVALMR